MADLRRAGRAQRARRKAPDAAKNIAETWRRLNFEQRVAAVAALLLVVSTFGPFSFVEAAVVLTAAGVLSLVRQRADRKEFHLPFGDGTVILAAGAWSALLIVVRLFDKPLGQSILALACAAILMGAGARERAKRSPDDLPPPDRAGRPPGELSPATGGKDITAREEDAAGAVTEPLATRDAPTEGRRTAGSRRPPPEPDDGGAPPPPAARP